MTQRDPDTVRHMLPRPVTKEVVSLATESAGMCSTAPSLSYYSEDWGRGWGWDGDGVGIKPGHREVSNDTAVVTLPRGLWSETSSVCLALWRHQKSERLGGRWGVGSERGISCGESGEEATGLGGRPDVGRGK